MMDTKNIDMRIKPASIAFFNHISGKHIFSNSRKIAFPCFDRFFSIARTRTKFSCDTSIAKKFLSTMNALIFISSLKTRSFVIAFTTAIFSLINPTRNMLKFFFADFAVSFNLNSLGKPFAFKTTIFRNIFSVILYIKNYFTKSTRNINSLGRAFFSRRIHHAS